MASIEDVSVKELRGVINKEIDDDKFKITPQKLGKILKSWGLKTGERGHEKLVYVLNDERVYTRLKRRFGLDLSPYKQNTANSAIPQDNQISPSKQEEVDAVLSEPSEIEAPKEPQTETKEKGVKDQRPKLGIPTFD